MIFFLICAVMTAVVLLAVIAPMLSGSDTEGGSEIGVYKAQLAELDRDVERGVLSSDEAERARTEIARRLLAADDAGEIQTHSAPRGLTRGVAAVMAVAVLGVGAGLYSWLGAVDWSGPYQDLPRAARLAASEEMRDARPSQAELEAQIGDFNAVDESTLPEDYRALVQQLRDVVPTRPDEVEGWELLARHEAALGRYSASAEAQRQVVQLKGSTVTASDVVRLLDLMVAATAGSVSPEAERMALALLDQDPDNVAGKYYMGLLFAQTDRPDVAFRLWRQVVDSGEEVQHVDLARNQIEEAAFRAGVDYDLPTVAAATRGPSAEDMANAADMAPEDQAAMIEGMVSNLSERLAGEGGTADEWAQLITALGVLERTDRAAAILGEARQVFADSPEDLAKIEAAASRARLE